MWKFYQLLPNQLVSLNGSDVKYSSKCLLSVGTPSANSTLLSVFLLPIL